MAGAHRIGLETFAVMCLGAMAGHGIYDTWLRKDVSMCATGAVRVDDMLREVSSQTVADDVTFMISTSNKHPDITKRFTTYAADDKEMADFNAARRRLDMLYYRVWKLHENGLFDDKMVAQVMEAGSVDMFLKYVQPYSEMKRGAKACMPEQRAFWERFSTKGLADFPIPAS